MLFAHPEAVHIRGAINGQLGDDLLSAGFRIDAEQAIGALPPKLQHIVIVALARGVAVGVGG